MVIYTTKEAGAVLDLKTDTVRAYCKRYRIGEPHEIGDGAVVWILKDTDLEVIRSHQREEGDDLGTDCEVLPSDEYDRGK